MWTRSPLGRNAYLFMHRDMHVTLLFSEKVEASVLGEI